MNRLTLDSMQSILTPLAQPNRVAIRAVAIRVKNVNFLKLVFVDSIG